MSSAAVSSSAPRGVQHLVTGEELNASDILSVLDFASKLKKERKDGVESHPLKGKQLAMLFNKPSLRTRFSFTVAMSDLGGSAVESIGDSRKQEEPEDTARVLSGYVHGIMIRTHRDEDLVRMARVSSVPVINALTAEHHPCQILADLMTLREVCGKLEGVKLAYVGDGNNILNSLLLMAPQTGVELHYCCPQTRGPKTHILERAAARGKSLIFEHKTPEEAVRDAHAVYTDVWASMGFEGSAQNELFDGFQVNEALMAKARSGAVFLHCMPMVRGQEVSETLPDSPASVIFQQSENRLHVQKSLLVRLMA